MARSQRMMLEHLEDRTAPAVFGIPWSDARHLTLSFVPDGTPIAGQPSNLFATLNAQRPTAARQLAVLRAVQTWAVHANISVSVVPDGGQPFGTPGLTQGDPRFGDIRIGAQPMSPEVMSISVPHDPYISGTFSGDVFLNSTIDFNKPASALYGVMLHELGHVLGLGDNRDPRSVLYVKPTSLPMQLSRGDVASLQALYGRPAADVAGNHTFSTASRLRYPGVPSKFDGKTPLVAYGSITSATERDLYSVRTPGFGGAVTVRLQSAGLSLLEPRLVVLDGAGHVLGQAQSTSPLGDTITVHLSTVPANSLLYMVVSGATKDVFGVGRFGLAVSFDDTLETSAEQIDAVLRGPFETLPASQIDAIFRDPEKALFHTEYADHKSLGSALVLKTMPGYAANRHYEIIDNIEGDPAYYRLWAPLGPTRNPVVLTVAANAMSVHGIMPAVTVLDRNGQPVASRVLVNGEGAYTIQAAGLTPGATYYLKLDIPDYETETEGNFSLVADFNQPLEMLQRSAAGTLTAVGHQQASALYVAETQLFHFVLSGAGEEVRMQVMNASGTTVFDLTAPAGVSVSGPSVLLAPGAYRVVFTTVVPAGTPFEPTSYQVWGASLSDPIGPILNNPTLAPMYTNPNPQPGLPPVFFYPNGTSSTNPFLWVPLAL